MKPVERHALWSHVAYPHGSMVRADDPERRVLTPAEGADALALEAVRIAAKRFECPIEIVPLADPDFTAAVHAFAQARAGIAVIDAASGEIEALGVRLTLRFLQIAPTIEHVDFAWVFEATDPKPS